MTNCDHKGEVFLAIPYTNDGIFFFLAIQFRIFILK